MWLYVPSAFVPESAVSTWDSSALERLARSVTSNGKHSRPQSWSRRWKLGTWLQHLSGLTYEPSTLKPGVEAWISSLAAIPASPSALPAAEPGQTIPDTSGPKSCGSTATQEPATSSVRTSLDTSALASGKSSRTLPSWGRMSNGVCSRRQTLELPIAARDCSSWPTATAGDAKSSGAAGYSTASGRHSGTTLTDAVKMWPTPVSSEARQGYQDRTRGKKGSLESLTTVVVNFCLSLQAQIASRLGFDTSTKVVLNPLFVEALMGFPVEFTAFEDSATPSSPK